MRRRASLQWFVRVALKEPTRFTTNQFQWNAERVSMIAQSLISHWRIKKTMFWSARTCQEPTPIHSRAIFDLSRSVANHHATLSLQFKRSESRTAEFSERGRKSFSHKSRAMKVAQRASLQWFVRVAPTISDAIHHQISFNETRSECQLSRNTQSAIAESNRRCFDRFAPFRNRRRFIFAQLSICRGAWSIITQPWIRHWKIGKPNDWIERGGKRRRLRQLPRDENACFRLRSNDLFDVVWVSQTLWMMRKPIFVFCLELISLFCVLQNYINAAVVRCKNTLPFATHNKEIYNLPICNAKQNFI